MSALIKLIWKSAPYLLIAFFLCGFIAGLGAFFGPPPPANPVTMSMQEIQKTPPGKLPAWVRSEDGYLDWSEGITVYSEEKKTGEIVDYECMIVPLVSRSGCEDAPRSETLMLVSIPWDVLKEKYPEVVGALDSPDKIAPQMSAYPVSFAPAEAESEFAFGIKHKVLEKFESMGFRTMVVVNPGSEPMTRGGGLGLAVVTFAGCIGCGYWIRSRRKAKVRSYVHSLVDAGLAGMRKGLDTASM